MMLFALTIDTATAQTPETTTTKTETVEKEGWWKRTFGKKKKKKKDTAQTLPQTKPRTDAKTGGVKPPKTGGVKPPKTGGVKPTKSTKKATKPKTDRVKPDKVKTTTTRPEGTKTKKATKPKKDIPVVKNKKDQVKPSKSNKPTTKKNVPTGINKGKKVNKKQIPNNNNGKVRKVESKTSKQGAPQCGVEGCEHPGKHLGLHKHQNPVRPYKKTAQGYKEIDENGNVIMKNTNKKVKKIKNKN